MRQAIAFFVLVLSVVVFYNFIMMIVHNQEVSPTKWTSGDRLGQLLFDPVTKMPEKIKKPRSERLLFHVTMTGDQSPYSKWQCRIMYYWYNKKKDLPGSEMGKFTRILHSGNPDNLMDEIPTFVVDPLPEDLDRGYPLLNRPWAFVQWLEKATIEEEYILMAEPDHIFINPLRNLVYDEYPAAFPFLYIKPFKHERIIRKFFPDEMGPVTNIDPIGNSPVIIKKVLLQEIAPTWLNVSMKMKNDQETDNTFGRLLEMYAYAVASALHGVQHILRKEFMLQPPRDFETGKKFILHYTYACDYNMKGELIYKGKGEWRFDQSSYLDSPPPRNLSLPPRGAPESVVTLIKLINEATADIPNWDTTGEVTNLKTSS